MDNAIVLDDYRVLNEDGLRYEDEFVKHKISMPSAICIYWATASLAEFSGFKSGMRLTTSCWRTLIATKSAWEEVTFESWPRRRFYVARHRARFKYGRHDRIRTFKISWPVDLATRLRRISVE